MPISEKQLAANRKNAQKSTGPTTDEGKAVASRNSIKHGLYSKDIVINTSALKEDQSQYDLLLDSLHDELQPTTLFQQQLVLKIANCLWRSRRVILAETAQINEQLERISRYDDLLDYDDDEDDTEDDSDEELDDEDDDAEDRERANQIGIRSIPNLTFSQNILRYEMRLDRQLTRAYKLLRILQLSQPSESPPDRQPDK